LNLPYAQPLDWEAMLAYFAARAIAGVERVSGGGYRRTVLVEGEPAVVGVSRGGPDHLVLHGDVDALAERARRLFGLDADVAAATAHLGADPVLGPLVRARPGLRVPGAWDPFETGVRAIVGQQVSVAGASTLTARIVERCGTPLPAPAVPGLTHRFPSPATLAAADLEGLGLTSARMAAIATFARSVAAGAVRLDRAIGLEPLVASITAIPGLGPWTAQYLALRMGEPDAFPASDLGVRRSLSRLLGRAVTARDATALAERWRPWRAHAAVLLWLAM
jgi:3-methyladenine DNA glycosylase/8-oxoguanine DNA glycosylase